MGDEGGGARRRAGAHPWAPGAALPEGVRGRLWFRALHVRCSRPSRKDSSGTFSGVNVG